MPYACSATRNASSSAAAGSSFGTASQSSAALLVLCSMAQKARPEAQLNKRTELNKGWGEVGGDQIHNRCNEPS